MMEVTAIVFVVAIVIWFVIANYNMLIELRNHIDDAWSNIDTELMRRYDLIPNIVAAVKGYAAHERETLEHVITLRNLCHADHGPEREQVEHEKEFVGAIQKLLAVAEAYPDLKADGNFMQLQKELVNTEDRIQAARRFYNGNVRDYRNRRESFPSNLVANMFSFGPRDFYDVDPAVRATPSVAEALTK